MGNPLAGGYRRLRRMSARFTLHYQCLVCRERIGKQMMLPMVRAFFFVSIVGMISGLLMALDPLLPVLNVRIPLWMQAVLTPSVLIFRMLVLFGPIALLVGGLASYRVTKRSHQWRDGLYISGLTGICLLIATIVFFGTIFFLVLQDSALRQLLNTRASQLGRSLGVAAPATVLSPAVLMFAGSVALGLSLYNLLVALVSGACGSWLAVHQRTPRGPMKTIV